MSDHSLNLNDPRDLCLQVQEWTKKLSKAAATVQAVNWRSEKQAVLGLSLDDSRLTAFTSDTESGLQLWEQAKEAGLYLDFRLSSLPNGDYVKVATSGPLRFGLDALNITGSEDSAIPWNAGGRPLAASLTSGLLGGGLGYGAGRTLGYLFPRYYDGKAAGKRLGLAGALAGSSVGLGMGALNMSQGLDFNDNTLYSGTSAAGFNGQQPRTKHSSYMPPIELDALGDLVHNPLVPASSRNTIAGTMYAASQMPDPNARPGYVTPHQTGLLSSMLGVAGGAAKGYILGRAAGGAIGALTGATPQFSRDAGTLGLLTGGIQVATRQLLTGQ